MSATNISDVEQQLIDMAPALRISRSYGLTDEQWHELNARAEKQRHEQLNARAKWLVECADSFPLPGISGDFDGERGHRKLNIWPTKQMKSYPEVTIAQGWCDFCEQAADVLVAFNKEDSGGLDICPMCIEKVFNVWSKKVYG